MSNTYMSDDMNKNMLASAKSLPGQTLEQKFFNPFLGKEKKNIYTFVHIQRREQRALEGRGIYLG